MALVNYSDSDNSDNDAPASTSIPVTSKPSFQKVIDRSQPRKIKVDLPAVQPEQCQTETSETDGRPAKRQRIGGGLGGFNSLLPAPKRAAQSGPKPGVSLKTSSEPVFSRRPANLPDTNEYEADGDVYNRARNTEEAAEPREAAPEVKIVGKATRFRPLSVVNKKKPSKKQKPPAEDGIEMSDTGQAAATVKEEVARQSEAQPPKPKKSLFSMHSDNDEEPGISKSASYEPLVSQTQGHAASAPEASPLSAADAKPSRNSSSLQTVAADLNLTPAERRQLFGRKAKDEDVQITHFNIDHEYAANEQARQDGEVVEHRAVKTIAPGKHSLQQLVNNARSQQDAMEDKWADGRRERGEAGSKYGWGR